MRTLGRLVVGLVLSAPAFFACGSKGSPTFTGGGGSSSGGSSDDSGGSSSGFVGDDSGFPVLTLDADMQAGSGSSKCKGGLYQGTFAGSYSSSLTLVGLPLTVTGNVQLQLHQEGSGTQMCMLAGEALKCSDVFALQDGTITGVANGDDAGGGYPYYCVMTGTLNCAKGVLVGGWIDCTYCLGPLNDGGMSCATGGTGGGKGGGMLTGTGGQFGGPLTASYDTNTTSFVNGSWNGSEALVGMGVWYGPDGGPDGAPVERLPLGLRLRPRHVHAGELRNDPLRRVGYVGREVQVVFFGDAPASRGRHLRALSRPLLPAPRAPARRARSQGHRGARGLDARAAGRPATSASPTSRSRSTTPSARFATTGSTATRPTRACPPRSSRSSTPPRRRRARSASSSGRWTATRPTTRSRPRRRPLAR